MRKNNDVEENVTVTNQDMKDATKKEAPVIGVALGACVLHLVIDVVRDVLVDYLHTK